MKPDEQRFDRLTLFAWLWACQALVHHEFYSRWVPDDARGWAVAVLASALFLRPSSVPLLVGLLASSVVYNVAKWPFVVNHILVESVVNVTLLAALALGLRRGRAGGLDRDAVVDRAAPVVRAMVVTMYAFAFVAKLNDGFVDPTVSCVVQMYGDLVSRFPFLPETSGAHRAAILGTLLVEAAIPLLLVVPRTRPLGVLLGVGFHALLGLVGHRTFSALAYAVYALFLLDDVARVAARSRDLLLQRVGAPALRRLRVIASLAFALGVAALIGAYASGAYDSGIGPLKVFRLPWMIWIGWSSAMAAVYVAACALRLRDPAPRRAPVATPGLLWLAVPLVAFNGLSQYLGLKTQTSFTMYSNLRTEGEWNNHWFMPALRLAPYQDELVQVLETDDPALAELAADGYLVTRFELRRLVHGPTPPAVLVVRLDGRRLRLGAPGDEALSLAPLSLWQEKLLYFRPVPTGPKAACGH